MRVGFNEFSDRESICRFSGRDPQVRAHEKVSWDSRIARASVSSVFTALRCQDRIHVRVH
jgi:hypothetical protein